MPANLPPHYFEAEKRYREAKTPEEKIRALEEMLTIMPKHKGTDKLRAALTSKIAKFKAQAQQKKSASRRDVSYVIEKEGALQVALVGPPNTGKSSILSVLTKAQPEIADFPHTTWKPLPGMAQFENIQFQLIDTPPINPDYVDPWMSDLMRRADILAIVVDIKDDPFLHYEETVSVLKSLRIYPQGFPIPDDLKKRPFVKKCCVVVNKVDTPKDYEDFEVFLELAQVALPCIPFSTRHNQYGELFLRKIYELGDIIRVYTKAPGKEPDLSQPFVLPKDSTLEELAGKIHKDFLEKLKYAKIWGKAVFDGQMVQKDYVLQDGDIVELHI
ncbi:TGS domain-containing protein [Thermodesulforhabdus norvegica]|uniref:TGS domain-containing protein n=1 Tax=Thermodesulforhabdus norvegica TaxID=39841 RepID=A0A1I4VKB9_9BACT|nr:TGS domain-containing protein [Thermodesulforhabdus norvegica]SFN01476.1 hypothetical protein SAMN05660836_02327 [Thermodesulforhabdus norvegica]